MHQRFLIIVLFISLEGLGFAQSKVDYAVKVDVDSVFLNLSVREQASNRSLAGLQQNDFVVYEDGVVQEIQQFLPTEAPFNLLLLLDVSGSTGSYLKMMKQAAIEFTQQINPQDHIAVATFNSKVKLVQDFTNDREAAEKAIKRVKAGGGTAFYDALMVSITQYMRDLKGRSAIVVFTDGVDNQLEGTPESGSDTGFDELYRKIQEIDTIIYTIFLNTEEDTQVSGSMPGGPPRWPGPRGSGGLGRPFPFPFPFPSATPSPVPHPRPIPSQDSEDAVYRIARGQLRAIADQTGGRMYSPGKIGELAGAYSEIADDLRVQYQLGYNSTNKNHDGKWRKIRVELGNKHEAVVRTRPGYYAAREEMTQ